jgi:hypothetical protein
VTSRCWDDFLKVVGETGLGGRMSVIIAVAVGLTLGLRYNVWVVSLFTAVMVVYLSFTSARGGLDVISLMAAAAALQGGYIVGLAGREFARAMVSRPKRSLGPTLSKDPCTEESKKHWKWLKLTRRGQARGSLREA